MVFSSSFDVLIHSLKLSCSSFLGDTVVDSLVDRNLNGENLKARIAGEKGM